MVGREIPILDVQLTNVQQLCTSTMLLWTKVFGMFSTSCLTTKTFTSYDLDVVPARCTSQCDVSVYLVWEPEES